MSTTLLISIGIPGSGKTTFLRNLATEKNYTYISPDSLREQLTGDMADQSENENVWKTVEYTTEKYLSQGISVVIDATFTEKSNRERFIQLAKDAGAETVGILFDIPLETALERNAKRERIVPEHIVKKMHTRLSEERPALYKEFDTFFTIHEKGGHTREITNKVKAKSIPKELL
jgi:predicted kinase